MSGLHKVRLVTFGTQTRIYLDDQAKYGVHRFWGDRRINIGFDDRRPIILRGKSCIGIRVENNGQELVPSVVSASRGPDLTVSPLSDVP